MASLRTVTLVGVDGSRHQIVCDPGGPYELTAGQLWGLAPYQVKSSRVGEIPGERLDGVRALARTFAVPLLVKASSELTLDQRLAGLAPILTPRDDVRIIFERPDGSEREITARYISGGNALEVTHNKKRYLKVPLVFRAMWPYWRAIAADVVTVGPTSFDDGAFGGSDDLTLTNAGDVDTWAEFTITGHAESIEALHLNSGRVWRIKRVIETGQTLRIDTDPRSFGVWLDNVFDFDATDEISSFFPLIPGDNRVILRGNSDFVATIGTFAIRWRPHYETC